jgi:hypothetical protein
MPMFKTIRFAALVAGATVMAAPAYAQSSPVLGSWDTESVTDFGTFKAELTIAESGGAYTVAMVDAPQTGPDGQPAPAMASTISDVAVDGSSFSFTRTIDFQGQAIVLAYTGTVDGDALDATANSDFGAIPVKGTRKP